LCVCVGQVPFTLFFSRKRHTPLFFADPLRQVWRFSVANLDTPYDFPTQRCFYEVFGSQKLYPPVFSCLFRRPSLVNCMGVAVLVCRVLCRRLYRASFWQLIFRVSFLDLWLFHLSPAYQSFFRAQIFPTFATDREARRYTDQNDSCERPLWWVLRVIICEEFLCFFCVFDDA